MNSLTCLEKAGFDRSGESAGGLGRGSAAVERVADPGPWEREAGSFEAHERIQAAVGDGRAGGILAYGCSEFFVAFRIGEVGKSIFEGKASAIVPEDAAACKDFCVAGAIFVEADVDIAFVLSIYKANDRVFFIP